MQAEAVEGWRTIAVVPNENYGDACLAKLVRVAVALGYAIEDVELGVHFDADDTLHFSLAVPIDLLVHESERDPIRVSFGASSEPSPASPPALLPGPPVEGPPGWRRSDLPASRMCPDCSRLFDTVPIMHKHHSDLHGPNPCATRYQCDQCPKVWDNHKGMASHRTKEHGRPAEPSPPGTNGKGWDHTNPMLACSACEFFCATISALHAHCGSEHDRLPLASERTPLSREDADARFAAVGH